VKDCARQTGITKRVYPHLLRHSVATILLDSGQVPIDQVQKFLGHLHLSTTAIYDAETSLRSLGDNYVRALGGKQVVGRCVFNQITLPNFRASLD